MSELAVVATGLSDSVTWGPTMHCAQIAVDVARADEIIVRPVIAVAGSARGALEGLSLERFSDWEIVQLHEDDPALVRNEVLEHLAEPYVACFGADDLLGDTWLREAVHRLREASRLGQQVVVHPELTVEFDGSVSITRGIGSDDELFVPQVAAVDDHLDTPCVAPTDLHRQYPYLGGTSTAAGPDGWRFALDTLVAGWQHVLVPDTLVFKRRGRPAAGTSRGQVAVPTAAYVLPIDTIRDLDELDRTR